MYCGLEYVSLILNVGQPPFSTMLSAAVQGLLSGPASIANICKFPDIPEMVILPEVWAALNLKKAELFWAAFQLQDAVLELYISPG